MTNKECIDRLAEQIIPAVFKAEDALQKAKPERKERLKHLGEPGGEDPQQVADIAQMQRNHISRIEAGSYSVGFDTLQTIAEALAADIRIVPRN